MQRMIFFNLSFIITLMKLIMGHDSSRSLTGMGREIMVIVVTERSLNWIFHICSKNTCYKAVKLR